MNHQFPAQSLHRLDIWCRRTIFLTMRAVIRCFLFITILILVACGESPTPGPEPTTAPAATRVGTVRPATPVALPSATPTPIPTGVPRPATPTAGTPPAPTLETPAEGVPLAGTDYILRWSWPGELAGNEYFDVRVWREGESPHGIAWSKQPQYPLKAYIRDQGAGTYAWQIVVIQGEDGQFQGEVSPPSEIRTFRVEAVPTPNAGQALEIVPDGFTARIFARMPRPHITNMFFVSPAKLYVALLEGTIYNVEDTSGDGTANRITVFADGLTKPTGLTLHEGKLYIAREGGVSTAEDTDGDGIADEVRPLIDGLPAVYTNHQTNAIVFGPDNRMYLTQGATTDHGPETDWRGGTILVGEPDGSDSPTDAGYRLQVFASGLRNSYDLVISPTGEFFVTDNGPDQLDGTLTEMPPDEVNHVIQGENYGYPEYFGFPPPETGTRAPIVALPQNAAATGIAYVRGDLFPPEYQGDLFAAVWFKPGWDNVQVYHIDLEPAGDTYTGERKPFIRGLQHITDIDIGPDGALYVADFGTGYIWRITPLQ